MESPKSITPPDRFWLISIPGAMLATAARASSAVTPGPRRSEPIVTQSSGSTPHPTTRSSRATSPGDAMTPDSRMCPNGCRSVPKWARTAAEVSPIFQPASRSPSAILRSRTPSCTRNASSNESRPTISGGKYSPRR